MENNSALSKEEEQLELPPGFRFHPSDEELITHYLTQKVIDNSFCAMAIGEADMNKCEPWDLPRRAKLGEKEWYFFCVRDRKYPTGLRTNRATDAGYWKATGKDKEIYRNKTLVGMKKTLVFYKGRAPRGEKTSWVMHEYRLEGKYSVCNLPKTEKNEWVICRVFQKIYGGIKAHFSSLARLKANGNELKQSILPPLTDSSPYINETRNNVRDTSHIPCFSNEMEDHKPEDSFNNSVSPSSPFSSFSPTSLLFSKTSPPNHFNYAQIPQCIENLEFSDSALMSDQCMLRMLLESQGPNLELNPKVEISLDIALCDDISSLVTNHKMAQKSMGYHENPSNSAVPVNLDCLWNY